MPVAQFMNIQARWVRDTDDLLVDRETRKHSESGEPMPLRLVEVREKWVYLKLLNPIGRKETFQAGVFEEVPIIRMVDTPEERLHKLEMDVAKAALNIQRRYWIRRLDLARDLLEGVRDKRSAWRTTVNFVDVGDAATAQREVERLADEEYEVRQWLRVYLELHSRDEETDTIVKALQRVRDGVHKAIIEGFDDNNLDRARRWLRSSSGYVRDAS